MDDSLFGCLSSFFNCFRGRGSTDDSSLQDGLLEEKEEGESEGISDAPLVVFLADYDSCFDLICGCGGSIIKRLEKFPRKGTFDYKNMVERTRALKQCFIDQLTDIMQDSHVECLSISARQTQGIDVLGAESNYNGKSFEQLPRLCEKRGWTFNNHLLPDDHAGEVGSTFRGDIQDVPVRGAHEAFLLEMKFPIINSQMAQLAEKHRGKSIDVHVFDDREDILDALLADLNDVPLNSHYDDWLDKSETSDQSIDCHCGCFSIKSGFSKVQSLQQEGGGRLLQIPENMTLHIHQAHWYEEYRNMILERRSTANDFVTDLGAFTSNGPVVDSVVESKEGERVSTFG